MKHYRREHKELTASSWEHKVHSLLANNIDIRIPHRFSLLKEVMDAPWDLIVVGAGVEGSTTAWAATKRGLRTLLLDKFPLPHTRGSSHGATRICRKAYEKAAYTRMMLAAYPLWAELEAKAAEPLLLTTGLLCYGSGDFVASFARSMDAFGLPNERLDHAELAKRFGDKMALAEGDVGVVDPEGGVLMADKCLRAFQRQFTELGGVLRDGEEVLDVSPGPVAKVTTSKGEHWAKSVVLCLGPWAGGFVERRLGLRLPLRPELIKVCYWRAKDGGDAYSAAKGFPTLITGSEEVHIYALPALEYPGLLKLCLHAGPAMDPERRDAADASRALGLVKDFVRKGFPWLHPEPVIVESCVYTWTPDGDFILDRHPLHSNIVIGAGFSGHGFKLAPVVGEVLVDLATGRRPHHDISHLRLTRFGGCGEFLPERARL